MLWVIVFAAIAVAGLIMVVCYAVWLAHKTSDVLSEVTELAARGEQLADLLGQIQVPAARVDPASARHGLTVEGTPERVDIDVR
ncbi:MAG: hypothetical protein ABWY56_04260 [Propionibacteriaceae bacterium]